jgi:hypothetical protein
MSFFTGAAIGYYPCYRAAANTNSVYTPLLDKASPTSSTFSSTIFKVVCWVSGFSCFIPNLSYFFSQCLPSQPKCLPSQPKGVNQQWKEVVGPRVVESFFNKGEDEKNRYDLEKIIKKINNYWEEGKTVCLFVGRTPEEPLPSDLNEAEENEVWVSGDIALLSSEDGRRIAPSEDRLHLWLDFNQQEGLILAKGLFKKIVIDCSTTKALNNNFVKNFSTMFQGPEGEMIFQNPTKVAISLSGVEETTLNTSTYTLHISMKTIMEQHRGNDDEIDDDSLDRLAKESTDTYFKTLYRNVEGLTTYPYTSNYEAKDPEQIEDPFACYKVSGLKQLNT